MQARLRPKYMYIYICIYIYTYILLYNHMMFFEIHYVISKERRHYKSYDIII